MKFCTKCITLKPFEANQQKSNKVEVYVSN